MIASRTSWRYALLAVAILAGAVAAFARTASTSAPALPDLALPAHERIDDGRHDAKLPRYEPEPRGVLDDTLIDQPRDRGF